jgi:hypothetical protein
VAANSYADYFAAIGLGAPTLVGLTGMLLGAMQNSAAVGYHRGPPARCSIPQHLIERDWEAVVPLRQVSNKIVILYSDVNSNRLKIHQVSSVRLQVNHRLLRRQWTQLLRS